MNGMYFFGFPFFLIRTLSKSIYQIFVKPPTKTLWANPAVPIRLSGLCASLLQSACEPPSKLMQPTSSLHHTVSSQSVRLVTPYKSRFTSIQISRLAALLLCSAASVFSPSGEYSCTARRMTNARRQKKNNKWCHDLFTYVFHLLRDQVRQINFLLSSSCTSL